MARKAMILKQKEEPKFSTRYYNRCKICGRPHAYLRDYGVCRITQVSMGTAADLAAVPMLTCVTTASAVSASASWLTKARSPAFARRLGKSFRAMLRF